MMRVARLPWSWSCVSQHRSQAQETWGDEMVKVPNGVVCAAVNGEVFFESGQSIRPGKVKETVKTHQREVYAANSRDV